MPKPRRPVSMFVLTEKTPIEFLEFVDEEALRKHFGFENVTRLEGALRLLKCATMRHNSVTGLIEVRIYEPNPPIKDDRHEEPHQEQFRR